MKCLCAKHMIHQVEVTEKPNVICDYDKNTGGVDVVDQYITRFIQLYDSCYSTETLQAGRSGDWIPVRWDFLCRSDCPKANPASYTTGTGSFLGVKWLKHDAEHLPPSSAGCEWVGALLPPPLYVYTSMSWDDLSIYHYIVCWTL
jgi:hypothetical protein